MKRTISIPFKDLTCEFIEGLETQIRALVGVDDALVYWDFAAALVWFDSSIISAQKLQAKIRNLVASSQVLILPH